MYLDRGWGGTNESLYNRAVKKFIIKGVLMMIKLIIRIYAVGGWIF